MANLNMRVISMALTAGQFVDGSKTVTRRLGWMHAKVGMRLRVVRKAMGLRKGERMETLGFIELLDVRGEPLYRMIDEPEYGTLECALEGFPEMEPYQFVDFFCASHGCLPSAIVRRLEFKKIEVDDGRQERLRSDRSIPSGQAAVE